MIRLAAIAIFALAALPLASQDTPVYHATSLQVLVPCVVTDANGAPVTGLKRADFHVFDDGVERDLSDFWTPAEGPVTLGVIVDVSNSQRSVAREHEAAAHDFLSHVLRQGERGFVVQVASDVTEVWEGMRSPTGFRTLLLPEAGKPLGEQCGRVDGVSLCGGTVLWNAVYYVAQLKLAKPQGVKALIVLSDGEDTGSPHSLKDAIAACVRSGIPIYAIRSGPASDLVRLSGETNGADFAATRAGYAQAFERIAADLRGQYMLAFGPGPGGPAHTLRVEVDRAGVTIRARTEYLPPWR